MSSSLVIPIHVILMSIQCMVLKTEEAYICLLPPPPPPPLSQSSLHTLACMSLVISAESLIGIYHPNKLPVFHASRHHHS